MLQMRLNPAIRYGERPHAAEDREENPSAEWCGQQPQDQAKK